MHKILGNTCSVCGYGIQSVLSFHGMPLTGIYSDSYEAAYPKFNQELMICGTCGHGQLKYFIEPEFLYGSTYGFRTSESNTATAGSNFFAAYLQKILPGKYFDRILEFGCNDGYLLDILKERGQRLVGLDPAVSFEPTRENIRAIKGTVEDTDFVAALGGPPDLVISQHTMEHLQNPKETLALLFDKVKEGCVFLLEFPCLDPLLQKYRFDQIFHQHLQYFSIGSALKLLDEIGAELIDYTFNFNYWGALLLAFRKPGRTGKTAVERKQSSWITPDEILRRYAFFQKQMAMTLECCLDTRRTMDVCGYGAALMLPVLAYHMKTDFEWLACVVDDDPSKQDKGYVNLPVKIQSPHGIDFQNSAILLTALDNRRPILRKLAAIGPKMILNPLCIT